MLNILFLVVFGLNLRLCVAVCGMSSDPLNPVIYIEANDNVTHGSTVWRWRSPGTVIDDVWFPDSDDKIRSLLHARLIIDRPNYFEIVLEAIQPALHDLVDLEHILSIRSANSAVGLQVLIDGLQHECIVSLNLTDLNNRAPQFKEPVPVLEFDLYMDYSSKSPLNSEPNELLYVEDEDMFELGLEVYDPRRLVSVKLTNVTKPELNNRWVYQVNLYFGPQFDPLLRELQCTKIYPTDGGDNVGNALDVCLMLHNGFEPRFESLKYYYVATQIPKENDTFSLDLKACVSGDRCRSSIYTFDVKPNELVEMWGNLFKFKVNGDKYAGQETTVDITATPNDYAVFGNATINDYPIVGNATLTIFIPLIFSSFETVFMDPLQSALTEVNITLPLIGEELTYRIANSSLDVPINTVFEKVEPQIGSNNAWRFNRDLDVEEMGVLQEHRIIVVEMEVTGENASENVLGKSVVVIPLSFNDFLTTTGEPEASTTVQSQSTELYTLTSEQSDLSTPSMCLVYIEMQAKAEGCLPTVIVATVVPIAFLMVCCSCTGMMFFYRRSHSHRLHNHPEDNDSLFSASIYNNQTSSYDGNVSTKYLCHWTLMERTEFPKPVFLEETTKDPAYHLEKID